MEESREHSASNARLPVSAPNASTPTTTFLVTPVSSLVLPLTMYELPPKPA